MIQLVKIGSSYKAHGIKGELEVFIEEPVLQWLRKEKVIFFNVNGNDVPFWITNIRDDSRIFIQLEDVHSPESLKSLCNKDIFIDKNKVPQRIWDSFEETISNNDLEGFTLIDQLSGNKAMIKLIQEFPNQLMATVEFNEREIYIPLHPDFIKKIDVHQKTILASLPEGIFEV